MRVGGLQRFVRLRGGAGAGPNLESMALAQTEFASRQLSNAEQRALSSFLAGRLPAGQLESELAKARQALIEPHALAPPVPHAFRVAA